MKTPDEIISKITRKEVKTINIIENSFTLSKSNYSIHPLVEFITKQDEVFTLTKREILGWTQSSHLTELINKSAEQIIEDYLKE